MQLPKMFEERMRQYLGTEFEEFQECLSYPKFSGLRVNTLKITPEELERLLPYPIKKVPWIENGYYYNSILQPAKHPYYYAGLYYIQEPSAMLPAQALPVQHGERVLDLCAAPGGKSTELAAKLNGTGILVSNDISSSRSQVLLKNIERIGVKNAVVMSEAPEKMVPAFYEYFDKILVDAPCSGEGMFRRESAMIKQWEQAGPEYYVPIQKEILSAAYQMLKPGGMLLYSTCTFSVEENEDQILGMLKEHPDMKVCGCRIFEGFDTGRPDWSGQSMTKEEREQIKKCIRIWPHKVDGEGHFAALLQKEGQSEYTIQKDNADNNPVSESMNEFFRHCHTDLEKLHLCQIKDRIYSLPAGLPPLTGLRVLRSGLLLGEQKKSRFFPSQALASSMKKGEYKNVLEFSSKSQEAVRYLKGETVILEDDILKGLQLVCVDGYPLGWGQAGKGMLKNKYPAGWRWM